MTRPSETRTATNNETIPQNVATFPYLRDWTPEYAAAAEFELVIQKTHLPVHKHVMSMSPVFQRELFKTESKRSLLDAALKKKDNAPVSTRMQLSSPLFMDVSVDDMCLLLSHVYATEATLCADRLRDVRKLFALTEEFEFHSITRRCVNFIRNTDRIRAGMKADLEKDAATAASEWLELSVKWDFDNIKDVVCEYVGESPSFDASRSRTVHAAGENFLAIYGYDRNHEPDQKWADLVMAMDSEVDMWKRVARSQAIEIESGPSLASLISDEPSTTLIYGVLIGIFAGCILPTWMFLLILIGTIWYIANRMPPGLLLVIQKALEGAFSGKLCI